MNRPLVSLLLASVAVPAHAQSTKYGPLALRLPASVRALSMGNIAIAGRDDDVLFYNPSQLAVSRGTSISAARMSPGARGGTLSTGVRLGAGGIGIGVNYLEYRARAGAYPLTRDDILDPHPVLGTSTLATLGYARVYRGFRIGVAGNYAVDQIGVDRFRSVVGDVGVSRGFARYFTGGLSLQHLGGSIDNGGVTVDPPMKATLGVAGVGPVGPLDVELTTAVSGMQEGNLSGGVGAEVAWSWLTGYSIAARGGVRHPNEPGDATLTGGFGFVADRVSLDLAVESLKNGRISYRAGLRVR